MINRCSAFSFHHEERTHERFSAWNGKIAIFTRGSNGGHHTKWMLEDFPQLFDGGIAGYGFNSQVSQWGSCATVIRNYDVIVSRIDDIIARRRAEPNWDPFTQPLAVPLTAAQLKAMRNIAPHP